MFDRFQLYRAERWIPFSFFAILLLIGIFIHGDYGLCWDDPVQRQLGLQTWDYVFGKNNDVFQNDNCYINPFIAALEVLPEKILKTHSESPAYKSKHLVNFIFCWAGMIFFYLLALRLFKNFRFALLSVLLLILTPRLFAHCFYNSKDMPFLFLFTASAYFFVSWLEQPSWRKIFWLAIFSGLLTATRVAGILFPVIVIVVAGMGLLSHKLKRRELMMIIVYLLIFPFSVYVFFPSLWNDPFGKFLNALILYSHHPYDVTTFFMGQTVHSLQTPWYYVLVWMAITIPIGWLIFFFSGIIFLSRNFIREKIQFPLSWFSIGLWFIVPLATEIILHANTYEDGRHLFFVEPPLLLIAMFGIQQLLRRKFSAARILSPLAVIMTIVIFLFTSAYTVGFLFIDHPFQYCYFNAVGRKYAQDYFDKDYWGLSFRNALEFLVKHDKSAQLKVRWKVDPCEWNLVWLNDYDRNRIHVVPYDQCDYYITNYRSHHPTDASSQKIYDVKVQGITIVAIYKMHPPNGSPNPWP